MPRTPASRRLPFTPGMAALLVGRLPSHATHEAMISGRRYGGDEAARIGFVQEAVAEDELTERALAVARALAGKDPETLGAIKRRTWAPILTGLRDRAANAVSAEQFA